MAITNTTNYSGLSPQMKWAGLATDIFDISHVSNTAQIVEAHQHTGTVGLGGLPVVNLNSATALANPADVRITSNKFTYRDTSGNNHNLIAEDISATFSQAMTFTVAPSFSTVEINVKDLAVTGITGAITATRYVGGTASGAPVTGTFVTGDYVVAADGQIWICTSGGTQGTWLAVGGGMYTLASAGTLNFNKAARIAVTGTTTMTDLSNPPAQNTYVVITFQSASCQITNGGHWTLRNSTNFTSVAGGQIEGVIDGSSNFVEIRRSPGQGIANAYRGVTSANVSSNSTSFVDIDAGLSLSVTVDGVSRAIAFFSGEIYATAGGYFSQLQVNVDGSGSGTVHWVNVVSAGADANGAFMYDLGILAKGTHTIKPQWKISNAASTQAINQAVAEIVGFEVIVVQAS